MRTTALVETVPTSTGYGYANALDMPSTMLEVFACLHTCPCKSPYACVCKTCGARIGPLRKKQKATAQQQYFDELCIECSMESSIGPGPALRQMARPLTTNLFLPQL